MSSQTTGEGPSSSQVRMDEQGVLFSMTGMPGISPPPVSNSSSAQQCARDKMAMSCAPTHAVDRSGLFSALLCASTKLPPPPPTVLFDIFLESLSLSLSFLFLYLAAAAVNIFQKAHFISFDRLWPCLYPFEKKTTLNPFVDLLKAEEEEFHLLLLLEAFGYRHQRSRSTISRPSAGPIRYETNSFYYYSH